MKIKKEFLVFLFLIIQLFAVKFLHLNYLNFLLTAEVFLFCLLTDNILLWIWVLIPYFVLGFSSGFTAFLTGVVFYFLKDRTKISVKYSLVFFLFLYFFTVRYEFVLIKAVMPGFLAFVSVIYAITRTAETGVILSPALLAYTFAGIVYSFFYSNFNFLELKPYFLYSSDVVQIVIATVLFVSIKDLKKEFPTGENKHNQG